MEKPPSCACGCGRPVTPKSRQGKTKTGRPKKGRRFKTVWNKYVLGHNEPAFKGKKHSEDVRRKCGEINIGRSAWNKGKRTPDDVRKKQSKAARKRERTPEFEAKRLAAQRRASKKMSASQKKRFANLTPEERSEVMRNWHRMTVRPTKPELAVKELIDSLGLPFRYNGARGGERIDGLQPDFIRTDGGKDVVLVHGCYWHWCSKCYPDKFDSTEMEARLTDETERYRGAGYHPEVIWEHDLGDVETVALRLENLALEEVA